MNTMKHAVNTFRGNTILSADMTHQHLSNWCWYNKIVLGRPEEDISFIYEEIENRFGGEILPYNPDKDYFFEIGYLHSKGYVDSEGNITFEGEIIGKISN